MHRESDRIGLPQKTMTETRTCYDSVKIYQKDIGDVFISHKDRLIKVRDIAADISADIEHLSVFIQKHTPVVCPDCSRVCCINRHSYPAYDDVLYLYARGEIIPRYTAGLDDYAPCQFLGHMGCSIPRVLRPYRCNWYFCTPLLHHIVEHNSSRHYRFFINLLEQITGKRQRMMEEYAAVVKNIASGYTWQT